MSRRVQDFTHNANLAEHRAALGEGDRHIVVHRDVQVLIPGLGPGFHQRDGADLHLKHKQRNARILEFLRKSSMVNMVMSGQPVSNLFEGNTHALEIRAHRSHGARITEIHEQPRSAGPDNPVVRRAVPHVYDGCLR